jgi:hypothetical protein
MKSHLPSYLSRYPVYYPEEILPQQAAPVTIVDDDYALPPAQSRLQTITWNATPFLDDAGSALAELGLIDEYAWPPPTPWPFANSSSTRGFYADEEARTPTSIEEDFPVLAVRQPERFAALALFSDEGVGPPLPVIVLDEDAGAANLPRQQAITWQATVFSCDEAGFVLLPAISQPPTIIDTINFVLKVEDTISFVSTTIDTADFALTIIDRVKRP